jgi:hypothetical protein
MEHLRERKKEALRMTARRRPARTALRSSRTPRRSGRSGSPSAMTILLDLTHTTS